MSGCYSISNLSEAEWQEIENDVTKMLTGSMLAWGAACEKEIRHARTLVTHERAVEIYRKPHCSSDIEDAAIHQVWHAIPDGSACWIDALRLVAYYPEPAVCG